MDIYSEPMMTVSDAALYLGIPAETLRRWRADRSIHSLRAERHGWPTLPFAAVVEAYVLRSLRQAGFPLRKIKDAAEGVRRAFKDDFGLARPNVVYDAADIFIEAGGELFRARDHQQAIRETVEGFKKVITWSGQDPTRLILPNYGGNVILDPRFGWGKPVVASNKVPVEAILGMWRAGESLQTVADEFDMSVADVEELARADSRSRAA